jgi:hypothetical protein
MHEKNPHISVPQNFRFFFIQSLFQSTNVFSARLVMMYDASLPKRLYYLQLKLQGLITVFTMFFPCVYFLVYARPRTSAHEPANFYCVWVGVNLFLVKAESLV